VVAKFCEPFSRGLRQNYHTKVLLISEFDLRDLIQMRNVFDIVVNWI